MINNHFCSDKLMGTSFMTEAESCHNNEPATPACPNHPVNEEDKKDCCSSQFHLVKTELNYDLYQPQIKTFKFSELLPVLTFISLEHKITDRERPVDYISNWDPPSYCAVSLTRIQQFLC
jgi:hypothetical protein